MIFAMLIYLILDLSHTDLTDSDLLSAILTHSILD
jgi:hypothetical protein